MGLIQQELRRLKSYFWGRNELPPVREISLSHMMGYNATSMTRSYVWTNHYIMNFANGATHYMDYHILLPREWFNKTMYVDVLFMQPNTATGNFTWGLEYYHIKTGINVNASASGSDGVNFPAVGIAYRTMCCTMDIPLLLSSTVTGIQLRLIRWGAAGTDTVVADAYFHGIRLRTYSET